MMKLIECPKPVYDKMVNSGLSEIVKRAALEGPYEERVPVYFLGPNGTDKYAEIAEGIFDRFIQDRKKGFGAENPWLRRAALAAGKVAEECKEDEWGLDGSELVLKYPEVLAYRVLGNKVGEFESFGFSSPREMEEAIASFHLGEIKDLENKHDWIWRSGNYKNLLSNAEHGDLCVIQTDVSGSEREEKTLFGIERKIETARDVSEQRRIINAGDDGWNILVWAALKYAKHLGLERMDEIEGWRRALREEGRGVGTFTAEAEFGIGDSAVKMRINGLRESCLIIKGREKYMTKFPLSIYTSSGGHIYPSAIDHNLVFAEEDKKGEIRFDFPDGCCLRGKKFFKLIEYSFADLPWLLKGSYRLFARDRSVLRAIMNDFVMGNRREVCAGEKS